VLVTLNEIKDRDGAVLQTSTSPFEALAVNVYSTPPALTLDWECHSRAWSRSWSVVTANATPPEPKVEEVTFDWGEEGMLFTVTQSVVIPDQEIEQTSERSFGYELSTGRLVSIRTSTFGKIAGEPFSLLIDQSLASGE
jgi:hypothetical protein